LVSVIHRADYHEVLLNEAKRLGVDIRLGASVCDVDLLGGVVHLENGTTVTGDVVVGADGTYKNVVLYSVE